MYRMFRLENFNVINHIADPCEAYLKGHVNSKATGGKPHHASI